MALWAGWLAPVLADPGSETPYLLGGEWSGSLTPELQVFFQDPDTGPDYRTDLSVAFEPQYYLSWDEGDQALVVRPFARLDQRDGRRSHLDLRELNWLMVSGDWEWLVGVGKVFWGVTEFVHLVDIINQTDQVEDTDGEDKLGQPMVKLAWLRDWGAMEVYVMPYFRERTFAGRGARLRPALVVDTHRSQYESGAKRHHMDLAARISGTLGVVDVGLSQFIGTAREPELTLGTDGRGRPVLIPRYNQIRQTGLELQAILGDWLWKLEALRQDNPAEDFFAAIGGFEYTFFGVFETAADIGVVSEYSYDGRDEHLVAPFQNDLFLGLRLTRNDVQSTQLLAGLAVDLDNRARTIRIEAARRFGDHWKLDLELQTFSNLSEKDPLFDLDDDGFVRFDLGYFF